MQNPRLGILALGNKPKKGRKMARRKHKGMRQPAALRRYWATHKHKGHKKSTSRRRRRARKNWTNSGAMVPINRPRRRKHTHANPHRRRRHHPNPALLGLYIPPVRTVAFGALGFASPPLVQGFLTSIAPSIMQTAMSAGLVGKYAVKVASVALTSWAVSRFVSRGDGNAVAIGGAINLGLSLVNDFAPGFLPANPLSAYVPVRAGLHAYVPNRPGLRAVPQIAPRGPIQQGRGHMPAGTAANVGASPMWGPALRYQRY
jgi:hypothetical protein